MREVRATGRHSACDENLELTRELVREQRPGSAILQSEVVKKWLRPRSDVLYSQSARVTRAASHHCSVSRVASWAAEFLARGRAAFNDAHMLQPTAGNAVAIPSEEMASH